MEKVKRSESEDPVKEAPEPVAPDPEVPEKPRRRTFSAQYKLRILQEVEGCQSLQERLRTGVGSHGSCESSPLRNSRW